MYYVYATKMDESTVHSVETYVPCVKVKNGWDKKEGHRINFTIWTYRGQLELYRYWICLQSWEKARDTWQIQCAW